MRTSSSCLDPPSVRSCANARRALDVPSAVRTPTARSLPALHACSSAPSGTRPVKLSTKSTDPTFKQGSTPGQEKRAAHELHEETNVCEECQMGWTKMGRVEGVMMTRIKYR